MIARANAEGDVPMVENAGLQALSLMNRMAEIAEPATPAASRDRDTPADTALSH